MMPRRRIWAFPPAVYKIRKPKAHGQAWTWQDEHGFIEYRIMRLEKEKNKTCAMDATEGNTNIYQEAPYRSGWHEAYEDLGRRLAALENYHYSRGDVGGLERNPPATGATEYTWEVWKVVPTWMVLFAAFLVFAIITCYI